MQTDPILISLKHGYIPGKNGDFKVVKKNILDGKLQSRRVHFQVGAAAGEDGCPRLAHLHGRWLLLLGALPAREGREGDTAIWRHSMSDLSGSDRSHSSKNSPRPES